MFLKRHCHLTAIIDTQDQRFLRICIELYHQHQHNDVGDNTETNLTALCNLFHDSEYL